MGYGGSAGSSPSRLPGTTWWSVPHEPTWLRGPHRGSQQASTGGHPPPSRTSTARVSGFRAHRSHSNWVFRSLLDHRSVLLLFTFGLIVCALLLIARSIAVPLVNLSKAVGASSGELVPIISVLHRKDEIGGLNRVMREMSRQVQEHFDQVVKSEMSLRTLNQELSASESRYRGLVDHAPIGIFTTKGMQVTFSNRHNQILAGLDPDEQVDPASFRARIHPEDLDRVLSDFSRTVAASRQCELIFRFVHADGGVLTILSRRVPISDFDSPDPIYVGFNIDITALHELQLRLSRTEKLATLGQMMDRIVNQIVEYARTRELALTQFTLSDLVNEVLKLLNGPLEAKHLKVRTFLSPPADRLHADRDQIEQVLLNVIGNAIDASPMDGLALEITAHEASHQDLVL